MGKLGWLLSKDINGNIPTTSRWARGDWAEKNMHSNHRPCMHVEHVTIKHLPWKETEITTSERLWEKALLLLYSTWHALFRSSLLDHRRNHEWIQIARPCGNVYKWNSSLTNHKRQKMFLWNRALITFHPWAFWSWNERVLPWFILFLLTCCRSLTPLNKKWKYLVSVYARANVPPTTDTKIKLPSSYKPAILKTALMQPPSPLHSARSPQDEPITNTE